MAISENLLKKHQDLEALAVDVFENQYKPKITSVFIENFGKSYHQADGREKSWRNEYEWTKERENSVIMATKTFICLLPETEEDYKNPRFWNCLISKISEYLSVYTARSGDNKHNESERLFNILFTENRHVQRLIQEYEQIINKVHAKNKKNKHKKKLRKARGQIIRTGKTMVQIEVLHTDSDLWNKKLELAAWVVKERQNQKH